MNYYIATKAAHGLVPYNLPVTAAEALSFVRDAAQDGFAIEVRDDFGKPVSIEALAALHDAAT